LPARNPEPLAVPAQANHCWSMDFMCDSLQCGRRFRAFNVVDDFNREVLAIEVDLNLPSQRIIRVLERVVAWRGYPNKLRMDNGPEFISVTLASWAEEHGITLEFIKPGKPTQNSYIERFNRTYRTEILDMYVFRFFFAYSHYFIVGMLSYTLYENYAENNRSHKLFLSLTILLFTFVFFLFGLKKGLLSTAGLIIWVLVFYCEYMSDRFNNKLSRPITVVIRSKAAMYLGKISYSMYCSHMIFLYVCAYVFSTETMLTKINGLTFTLLMLIIPFCMTLLFSAVTFRFIEKPFIKLGKRLFL